MNNNRQLRKAPYRKKKTLSPQAFKEFLEEENISGFPADISNIKISCSDTFCSAITATKNVIAWGNDGCNQFRQTRVPKSIYEAIDIATCIDYSYVLHSDGTIEGWGNTYKPYYEAPVSEGVERIAGNGENFLALLGNGTLVGWGNMDRFDINNISPEIYDGVPIVDIAVGYFHAVALNADGEIFYWGNPRVKHTAIPKSESKVVEIKSNNEFTLGLTEDGTLIGWGTPRYGQHKIPSYLQVHGTGMSPVVSFAVGHYHCAAITQDGRIHVWGWDIAPGDRIIETVFDSKGMPRNIELDAKTYKYLITPPREVLKPSEDEIPLKIYAGKDITFALMSSGDVIGWGVDDSCELLDIPEVIPALTRPGQPNIDLAPYGINMTIDDLIQGRYDTANFKSFLAPLIKDDNRYIQTSKGVYQKGRFLGEGTYGKTFLVNYNGSLAVCKIIKLRSKQEIPNTLKEAAVNIIVQEEAKRLNFESEFGSKLCPEIFEFAYDGDKTLYIFQEKLDQTLRKEFENKRLTSAEIANMFTQLAIKLNWLYDQLEFNHRDLKSDNVMIQYGPNGYREVVLIDFGFACMTYRGIRIKASPYFEGDKCFQETRDLTFLLYELYMHTLEHRKFLPRDIGEVIRDMLSFKVRGQTCDLVKGKCDGLDISWEDIYDLLNKSYVYNPKATTDVVIEKMAPFLK
jgi:alpha-tubulin suppressor-like RCC1 family protein